MKPKLNLQIQLTPKSINQTYYVRSGLFFFYKPMFVPYNSIAKDAQKEGYEVSEEFGIIEKAPMIGKGWIGVPINNDIPKGTNIVKLEGGFDSYLHTGPYGDLKAICQNIMKLRPDSNEFYLNYLNSPKNTSPENLQTLILLRNSDTKVKVITTPGKLSFGFLVVGLLFVFLSFVFSGSVAIVFSFLAMALVLLSFSNV
jgi:hypothetical protein